MSRHYVRKSVQFSALCCHILFSGIIFNQAAADHKAAQQAAAAAEGSAGSKQQQLDRRMWGEDVFRVKCCIAVSL
jgi:hypothetical protein